MNPVEQEFQQFSKIFIKDYETFEPHQIDYLRKAFYGGAIIALKIAHPLINHYINKEQNTLLKTYSNDLIKNADLLRKKTSTEAEIEKVKKDILTDGTELNELAKLMIQLKYETISKEFIHFTHFIDSYIKSHLEQGIPFDTPDKPGTTANPPPPKNTNC